MDMDKCGAPLLRSLRCAGARESRSSGRKKTKKGGTFCLRLDKEAVEYSPREKHGHKWAAVGDPTRHPHRAGLRRRSAPTRSTSQKAVGSEKSLWRRSDSPLHLYSSRQRRRPPPTASWFLLPTQINGGLLLCHRQVLLQAPRRGLPGEVGGARLRRPPPAHWFPLLGGLA